MRTILKYPFAIGKEIVLRMPINAEPVLVAVLPGVGPCIWAKVDTMLPVESRHFRLTNTAEEQPEGGWHLQSFIHEGRAWHLWGVLPSVTPGDPYYLPHVMKKDLPKQGSEADKEVWKRMSQCELKT